MSEFFTCVKGAVSGQELFNYKVQTALVAD